MAGGIFTDRLTIQGRFPHLDRTGDSCPEEGDISVFLQHPADLLVQACPPVVHSNKDTCYLQRMSGVFLDQGNVAGELCQPHGAEHLCLRGDDQLVRTEYGVYLCPLGIQSMRMYSYASRNCSVSSRSFVSRKSTLARFLSRANSWLLDGMRSTPL